MDMGGPFQHDQPVCFQHIALVDDFQGVGVFEHGIGRIKVDQVELKAILAQGDDRTIEITANHPEEIGSDADFFGIVLDHAHGFRQVVDEHRVFGTAGKGFNTDVTAAGEAVEKYFFLDAVLQDIEKSELDLGHGRTDKRIFTAAQDAPLVQPTVDPDHEMRIHGFAGPVKSIFSGS